ncbi:hypothetical protein Plhal304r1_c009g0036581 [Plasmopara halstedii]
MTVNLLKRTRQVGRSNDEDISGNSILDQIGIHTSFATAQLGSSKLISVLCRFNAVANPYRFSILRCRTKLHNSPKFIRVNVNKPGLYGSLIQKASLSQVWDSMPTIFKGKRCCRKSCQKKLQLKQSALANDQALHL